MTSFTHNPFALKTGENDVVFPTSYDWAVQTVAATIDWERRREATEVSFEYPEGLWIDNSGNTNTVTIQVGTSLQMITVPPGQVMTAPIFCPRNPKFVVTNKNDGTANVGITYLLFTSWKLKLSTQTTSASGSATAANQVIGNAELVTINTTLGSPAQDGTDGTGIVQPAGGVGIRGWLSGIYNVLKNATIAVTQSGVWNITNVSGTVSLPTGAATSANQVVPTAAGTGGVNAASIQGIVGGVAVAISGAVSLTGTAGTGLSIYRAINGATSNMAARAVNGAHTIFGYSFANTNATDVYAHFYNSVANPPVPGTTNVLFSVYVPGKSTVSRALDFGIAFSNAIGVAVTAGSLADSDTTTITVANTVQIEFEYI